MSRTSYGVGIYAASEGHCAMTPRTYRPDGSTRGIIFGHGVTGNSVTWLRDVFFPNVKPIVDLYPCLGADLGGGTTFGNDTAIARVTDAKTYLQGTVGAASGQVILYGVSMGGAVVLNWARANVASVAGILLIKPAVDIEDIRANNRGSLQASIETAYTNNAGWQAVRATHNPVQYGASLAGIPISVWYGEADTTVVPATIAAFAAAVGSSCTLNSLGADATHANTYWPEAADQLAFLESVA